MQPLPEVKPAVKSKTVWGLVAMAAGALLTGVGLGDGDITFLSDGIQPADLGPALLFAGYIIKELGVRTAKAQIKGFFSAE